MKNIDELLKQALTPNDEPDYWLNQKILSMAKEEKTMKKKHLKPLSAVALSAAVILSIGSVSIYAARRFLMPEHVAREANDPKLTEAFQSDDAVMVNETQSLGGYDVTFLGTVSGKSLSEYETMSGNELHDDRTYAVVAIGRADQKPMPKTSDDSYGEQSFFVSPLIQGQNPAFYNSFTFTGGYFETVENGILYRIAECDNMEPFADRETYLCVSSGAFYDSNAYVFDETSGKISRNEEYDGTNALFRLPLDPSKADPDAAAEYIKKIDEEMSGGNSETETELSEEEKEISDFTEKLTPENLATYAAPVESTRQTLTPDSDGNLNYEYSLDNETGSGSTAMEELFPDKKPGIRLGSFSYADTMESICIETFTLNEDGTVTFLVYKPK